MDTSPFPQRQRTNCVRLVRTSSRRLGCWPLVYPAIYIGEVYPNRCRQRGVETIGIDSSFHVVPTSISTKSHELSAGLSSVSFAISVGILDHSVCCDLQTTTASRCTHKDGWVWACLNYLRVGAVRATCAVAESRQPGEQSKQLWVHLYCSCSGTTSQR